MLADFIHRRGVGAVGGGENKGEGGWAGEVFLQSSSSSLLYCIRLNIFDDDIVLTDECYPLCMWVAQQQASAQRRLKVFLPFLFPCETFWSDWWLAAGCCSRGCVRYWEEPRAYSIHEQRCVLISSVGPLLQRGARWEGGSERGRKEGREGGRALAAVLARCRTQVANVERAGCRSGMHSNYEYRSLADAQKLSQRKGTCSRLLVEEPLLLSKRGGEIYIYIVWCWWWYYVLSKTVSSFCSLFYSTK